MLTGQLHEEFDLEQISEIKESALPEFKVQSVDIRSYGLHNDRVSPMALAASQRSGPVTSLNSDPAATSALPESSSISAGGASKALDSLAAITARVRRPDIKVLSPFYYQVWPRFLIINIYFFFLFLLFLLVLIRFDKNNWI